MGSRGPKPTHTPNEGRAIIRAYKAGMSVKEICHHWRVSEKYVNFLLEENGL
jgi:DNA-binding NarL/FixJ family response regulator